MSRNPNGSTAFFCHQCDRVVTLTPLPNSDLFCPRCNGGFLEEHHYDPRLLSAFPTPAPSLSSSTTLDLGDPRFFSNPVRRETRVFDPFIFLQNHLQGLQRGGARVQVVIENHPSHPAFRFPPNIGDYFLGPGLEELVHQLAENDPNRHGTPPASKKAVQDLPTVQITHDLITPDSAQCAVCMDDFELASEAKQMPCNHIFHSDCILPWLELHNSCPVCRYELPTDDPAYENRNRNGNGNGNSSSNNGQGGEAEAGQGGESEAEAEAGQGGEAEAGAGAGSWSGSESGAEAPSLQIGSITPPAVVRTFSISLRIPLRLVSSQGAADNNGQGSGSEDPQASEHGQESREQG